MSFADVQMYQVVVLSDVQSGGLILALKSPLVVLSDVQSGGSILALKSPLET